MPSINLGALMHISTNGTASVQGKSAISLGFRYLLVLFLVHKLHGAACDICACFQMLLRVVRPPQIKLKGAQH